MQVCHSPNHQFIDKDIYESKLKIHIINNDNTILAQENYKKVFTENLVSFELRLSFLVEEYINISPINYSRENSFQFNVTSNSPYCIYSKFNKKMDVNSKSSTHIKKIKIFNTCQLKDVSTKKQYSIQFNKPNIKNLSNENYIIDINLTTF